MTRTFDNNFVSSRVIEQIMGNTSQTFGSLHNLFVFRIEITAEKNSFQQLSGRSTVITLIVVMNLKLSSMTNPNGFNVISEVISRVISP